MLNIKNDPKTNIIEVSVSGLIRTKDIEKLEELANKIISNYGKFRLMANISHFEGWESMKAMEQHLLFATSHQARLERLAMVTSHPWQQFFAACMSMFLTPEIKFFSGNETPEALNWLTK